MTRCNPLYALWMVLAMAACAGVQIAPQTLSQRMVVAESTATAANSLATTLVTHGTIPVQLARDVGEASDVVVACVRRGRSLLQAGDATGAQGQLSALAADLTLLETFIAQHDNKGKN